MPPVSAYPGEEALEHTQGIAVRQRGVGWEELVKELCGIDLRLVGDCLGEQGKPDEEQEDEGYRRQEPVERQCAGEKRKVVFISGLESAAKETADGPVPPAGPGAAQASGSSRSAGDRRRARASASRRSSSSRGEGLAPRS